MQVVTDPAELLEVLLHQAARLVGRDAQLLGEPVGGQAVGQPVVHRLDLGPQLGAHLRGRQAEHPGGRGRVEVVPRLERRDQRLVAGQVRHDPQLDLAVIRRQQALEARADHEAQPDLAAEFAADGDVLQVRVGGGEPAGGRDRLVERGVDPAVLARHRDQRVHDRHQLVHVAVPQQVAGPQRQAELDADHADQHAPGDPEPPGEPDRVPVRQLGLRRNLLGTEQQVRDGGSARRDSQKVCGVWSRHDGDGHHPPSGADSAADAVEGVSFGWNSFPL